MRLRAAMKVILGLLCATLALGACAAGTGPPDDGPRLERNTEFDGRALRFFVTLEDGTVASVSSADDVIGSAPASTPVPGHRAHALTFLKETEAGTSVSHALLSWDPDDPADYLAFGWWTEFPGQRVPDLSFAESEQYAIIDGPEIDHGIVPQVPDAGTAGYTGQAGGLHFYTFGSDRGADEGEFLVDEFQGVLTLDADFADGTIRGCIGCVGDLVTRRAHFGVFLGPAQGDSRDLARDCEIHLATAIIREDGLFRRDRVTLAHPERTIASSEGSWSGALSSRPDADGNPRLVAGFGIVDFVESDGSEGRFVGSFLGLGDAFRQDGPGLAPPGDEG